MPATTRLGARREIRPAIAEPQPGPAGAGLLARLHAREPDAFADLYRTHLSRLTRFVAARLHSRDRDVVADLVHDAFADAMADPTLIGADVLGSLLRLCGRACARHRWAQRRQLRVAHTIYEDQRPDEPHRAAPPAQAARAAVATLPAGERGVIHLRFVEGHPRQVTAQLLGRSVGSVIYLERRGCQRLREHLATSTPAAHTTAG